MYIEALEVAADHVHVCMAIPPQQSVGSAVGKFKNLSARFLIQRYQHLRSYLPGAVWSPSYFARTVGEGVTAETVLKYIETHDEHAARVSAQAEFFPKVAAGKRRARNKT